MLQYLCIVFVFYFMFDYLLISQCQDALVRHNLKCSKGLFIRYIPGSTMIRRAFRYRFVFGLPSFWTLLTFRCCLGCAYVLLTFVVLRTVLLTLLLTLLLTCVLTTSNCLLYCLRLNNTGTSKHLRVDHVQNMPTQMKTPETFEI